MKLPITNQFLWDIYRAIDTASDVIRFVTKPPTMSNYLPGPKNPIFDKYRKEKNKRKVNDLIYYLKAKGYIKVKNLQSSKAIILTKKGMDKVLKASFKAEKSKKRQDGKWIMLIFDIPEKYKKARNLMNSVLHNLGYKMFQQSVWVTPYDVSEKTERLLQFYSLDEYVKIFLIEEL